jgi:uncharacterized protein involved in exopolysaccharide biosynthesis
MKRFVRLASYLYPFSWRRRYAKEFDALLDEADTGWKDVFDILKGALTMQFTSWNLKSIALTFAMIGAAIAAAVAFSIPNQYQSTSVMQITAAGSTEGNAQGDVNRHMNNMEQEVLSRTSLTGLITGLDLYQSQRRERPLEDIVQEMRNHEIQIRPIHEVAGNRQGSVAFSISATYPDPKLAQAVTQELTSKFIKQNLVKALRGGDVPMGENLEVLDPASWPRDPIKPHKVQWVLDGLFAGLLAGLAVSYALRWRITIVRRPAH